MERFAQGICQPLCSKICPKDGQVHWLLLDKTFQPLIFILVKSTKLVNRKLAKKGQTISMEDLSEALDLATDVVKDEKEMLEGIVRFSNLEVEKS